MNYELDLIVVNVDEGIMKSGKPNFAASFAIADYEARWITIRLQKTGESCSTTISDSATDELLGSTLGGDCSLEDSGKVVINARGRDGSDAGDSFVSIRKVEWQPN